MTDPDGLARQTRLENHVKSYIDWLHTFVKTVEVRHRDLHDQLIRFINLLKPCLKQATLDQILPLLTVAYVYILALIAHFMEDQPGRSKGKTEPFLQLIGAHLDDCRLLELAESRFPHTVPIFHTDREISLSTYFSVIFQSNRFLIGPAVLSAYSYDKQKDWADDYIGLFNHVYYQLLNVDHVESLILRYGKGALETYLNKSKEREFILYLSTYLGWFSDDPATTNFRDKAASLRGFFHLIRQLGSTLADFFQTTFQIDIEKVEYATPKVVLGKQLFSRISHRTEELEAAEEAIFLLVEDFDVEIYRALNQKWHDNLPDSSTEEDPIVLHQTCLNGFRLVHQTIDLNDLLAYLTIYLLIYEKARQG